LAKSNKNLILISGKSDTGKSFSLKYIDKPEGVMYLCCEAGKDLPFKEGKKFKTLNVIDPLQVETAFMKAESMPEIHTIVIDTLTFMMDQFESQYVLTSQNTMSAWSDYAQFFKRILQVHTAKSTKNVVFMAHTSDLLNEAEMTTETKVKVKGSIMNQGVESYFSNVISTKKIPLTKLEDYKNPLLNITPKDERLGFKYVFQTQLTKDTLNERIRGPEDMWTFEETYIDNNIQYVINNLNKYYA
jgi:hypothetical protein